MNFINNKASLSLAQNITIINISRNFMVCQDFFIFLCNASLETYAKMLTGSDLTKSRESWYQIVSKFQLAYGISF